MTDDSDLSRRTLMQATGGSIAATSGCLGDSGDSGTLGSLLSSTASSSASHQRAESSLAIANLYTPSRNAEVVVWRDEDTIYADGPAGSLAAGSDFSSVLQTALDSGVSTVAIQTGTYRIEDDIEVPSGTIIQGMGSKTRLVVDSGRGLWVRGSKGEATSLVSDVDVGDDTLPVADASAFEEGQYVLVNSDRETEYRDQPYGEYQKVLSVDSANDRLHLEEGGLFDYYRTADDAVVRDVDLVEDVHIRDLQITGSDRSRYRSGVVAEYANRVHVRDCLVHDLSHSAVMVYSSMNAIVDRNELYDVGYPDAGIGYGVTVLNASRNVTVRDNVIYDCKNHCTAVGGNTDGFPRLVSFVGNDYYGDDADVHFGDAITFKNNRFTNCENGIITGAKSTMIEGCTFKNIENHGVRHRGNPDNLSVRDCTFRNIAGRGVELYRNPNRLQRVVITDSEFRNVGSNVVRHRLGDDEQMTQFTFSDNLVDGCVTTPVLVETVRDGRIESVTVDSNNFRDVGGAAFGTPGLDEAHVRITDNVVDNVENAYALVVRGRRVTVSGNSLLGFSGRGALVQAPGLVTGNHIVDGGNDALLVRGTDGLLVALNSFANTSGSDVRGIDVSDSAFVLNDLASGIDVDGGSNTVETNF